MPNAPEAGDILLDEYRIGVGDSLNVSVWRNPDLSAQVVVLPDGNISVPLAGNVRAAGLSTEALAATIKTALTTFIRQPEVTISVVAATSSNYLQRVRVTGAVNSPVSINYSRGLTVLDVVLLSGGVTPFANGNRAALYRTQDGEVKVYPILLDDILTKGKLETNYPLVPADVITVPEKSF
ncbi:MAG: polysaccharide export outer membrane protein [Candidatus Azotimanducaceae bacterium]|jgi:polysaccharide export outer membrane protein